MNKFLFKSSDADFQKLLQHINQNILYVTHMEDKILKIVQSLSVDKGVQEQVDNYFDNESGPDGDKE